MYSGMMIRASCNTEVEHLRMGYMVSVGDWLHLYALSDAQGFYKLPHYTHTKTKPKVCVRLRAEIPDLIRFVRASVRPPLNQLKWGVSGAPRASRHPLRRGVHPDDGRSHATKRSTTV